MFEAIANKVKKVFTLLIWCIAYAFSCQIFHNYKLSFTMLRVSNTCVVINFEMSKLCLHFCSSCNVGLKTVIKNGMFWEFLKACTVKAILKLLCLNADFGFNVSCRY